jgi:hypothetical protein
MQAIGSRHQACRSVGGGKPHTTAHTAMLDRTSAVRGTLTAEGPASSCTSCSLRFTESGGSATAAPRGRSSSRGLLKPTHTMHTTRVSGTIPHDCDRVTCKFQKGARYLSKQKLSSVRPICGCRRMYVLLHAVLLREAAQVLAGGSVRYRYIVPRLVQLGTGM